MANEGQVPRNSKGVGILGIPTGHSPKQCTMGMTFRCGDVARRFTSNHGSYPQPAASRRFFGRQEELAVDALAVFQDVLALLVHLDRPSNAIGEESVSDYLL